MNIPRSIPLLHLLLLTLLTLAVGLAAISQQSLWIDEGGPAFKSLMPTLESWWQITLQVRGSDVQMPVYMVGVWLWEKVMGNSEYALRAINLPFLLILVLALHKVRFWPLICLTSPFVLYYVGELRPYTMQMAAGACAVAAFAQVLRDRQQNGFSGLHAVMSSALFLSACSLTAVVWAGGFLVGVLLVRPDWLGAKGFWLRSLAWLVPALGIGGYYAFTLIEGYRATGSGGGGLLSLLFGFYEMAGLLGLGPSRNELRSSPMALLSHLPWLIPATACLGAAWCFGISEWFKNSDNRVRIAVAVAILLPILLLAGVGVAANFRVLGRHLSPAIPALLLPFCLCLAKAPTNRLHLVVGSLAILISLTSAISLRFDEKHARDDYRAATESALDALAKHQSVLWQADMNTARYYAFRKGGWPLVHAIHTLETDPPSGYMFADLVVINRPDIGYKNRDHRQTMKEAAFELQASLTGFEIWRNRYSEKQ